MVQERKEAPQDTGHPLQGAHNIGPVGLRSGRNYEKMLRIFRLFHHPKLASRERKYGRINQRLAYLKKPRFGKRKSSPNAEVIDNGENRKPETA